MHPVDEVNSDNSSKKLRSILKHFSSKSDMIEASAVITSDGLIKAELLGGEIEPERFGAMCASLLSLSKRAAKDTSRGELKLVLIEGTSGSMLVVQIGQRGVLALATKPKAKLGMIFVEARKTAQEIAAIL